MGRLVVRQVAMQKDMKIVAAIDVAGAPSEGKDIGEISGVGKLGVEVVGADKLAKVLGRSKPDVLIDFTIPEASVKNVKAASKAGVSVVVGTTGLSDQQREDMASVIKDGKIRAVISPNFSVGVNVFFKSVQDIARKLGKGQEVDIAEVHHVHKRDAPSGTALKAADIIAKELGLSKEGIRIKSVREGEVVGEHTVTFSNPYEQVEVAHRAKTRETFAAGAVKAARYVVKKGEPGAIKDMQAVLGL